jgi:hypothetical protein
VQVLIFISAYLLPIQVFYKNVFCVCCVVVLESSLQQHVFGQHLAYDIVVRALKAHVKEHASPKKALVLSFHGLSGSGKTFVSQFIINSLFKLGPQSKYAHFFAGRSHFPMESKADIYKVNI